MRICAIIVVVVVVVIVIVVLVSLSLSVCVCSVFSLNFLAVQNANKQASSSR